MPINSAGMSQCPLSSMHAVAAAQVCPATVPVQNSCPACVNRKLSALVPRRSHRKRCASSACCCPSAVLWNVQVHGRCVCRYLCESRRRCAPAADEIPSAHNPASRSSTTSGRSRAIFVMPVDCVPRFISAPPPPLPPRAVRAETLMIERPRCLCVLPTSNDRGSELPAAGPVHSETHPGLQLARQPLRARRTDACSSYAATTFPPTTFPPTTLLSAHPAVRPLPFHAVKNPCGLAL
jgi:hypothetical protein